MTRVLLTWLGFTILQLGIPRGMTATELQRGCESTRVVPQFEVLSNDVLARDASRSHDLRTTQAPPFAPVGPARISLTAPRPERQPQDRERARSISLAFLLPEARAPPA